MVNIQKKQSTKERLKEITDSIETGIETLFESEQYKKYLKTMSRFSNYSLNNTILITIQKPNATLVAGFSKWKNEFSRTVKKGEKGIKILAPTPYKVKVEQEKIDLITKKPILDKYGKIEVEEVENVIPMFRVVYVFDISQTEGEPLPTIVNELVGDVEYFELFVEALKRTSLIPIALEYMSEEKDGYYHTKEERIGIRDGMSEVQTISAIIHEMAHSLLHGKEKVSGEENLVKKDRNTEEVEAESISYVVCNYYGIETSENSFGYIANWSKGKELKELKTSLETIHVTASKLIKGIDKHFEQLIKEQDNKNEQIKLSKSEEESYYEEEFCYEEER